MTIFFCHFKNISVYDKKNRFRKCRRFSGISYSKLFLAVVRLAIIKSGFFSYLTFCHLHCCDRKAWVASAQSFTLWWQATIEVICHNHSIIACSCHIYIWVLFLAHIPFVLNHTFSATPMERLQQYINGVEKNLFYPFCWKKIFWGKYVCWKICFCTWFQLRVLWSQWSCIFWIAKAKINNYLVLSY